MLGLVDTKCGQLMYALPWVPACGVPSYGHGNGLRPKPCTITASTGLFRKVAVQSGLNILARGVLPSPYKIRDNTFEHYAVFLFVGCRRPVHQNPSVLFRYSTKRYRFTDPHLPAEPFNQPVIKDVHSLAPLAPGINCAVFQRDTFVRHNQVGVKLQNRPQTITALTCPIRTVKAEQPG